MATARSASASIPASDSDDNVDSLFQSHSQDPALIVTHYGRNCGGLSPSLTKDGRNRIRNRNATATLLSVKDVGHFPYHKKYGAGRGISRWKSLHHFN